ncbi:hypothetical protein ABFS82_04G126700 [Erythranthe guttata]|nr:PREDICTED: vinorine synthase-like [Erythranthe guttata]|eukprot:XP_012830558.1 PREDICTED: vinorine synthase-like [Erythranthe guttata]
MKIEILSKELVKPSSPTPTKLREFKLSFIDERIPHSYIPLILYYFGDNYNININNIRVIKSSLSDALVRFYPLAGRMKGQALLDCNDQGVLYIEANADAAITDVIRSVDLDVLDELVPFKNNGYFSSARVQLAVQATSFKCGGIAIGVCISHRIADAATLSSFITHWSATARRDQPNLISPLFNSALLFPPQNTPDFKPNFSSLSVQKPLSPKFTTKRFTFTKSSIDSLKSIVTEYSPKILHPSRIEVVTAFLWSRCAAAKGLGGTHRSLAFHPVNLRGKIPSLTEYSFGNIFQMVSAESDGGGTADWVTLVAKLRAAFGRIDSDYVQRLMGEKGFEIGKENFLEISKLLGLGGNIDVLRFSSYCRFAMKEADFGWGRPVWASIGSYANKDNVFLFESLEFCGGIEAWIVLDARVMERLQRDFELQRFTSSCFAW